MNVLIIEDELAFQLALKVLIREIDPSIQILNTIDSVAVAVEWLQLNKPPDLIFLDIQLKDGMSFEIFEQTEIKSPVIFTTSFNEYAIKAFETNSIDYIVKPLTKEKLLKSLDKLEKVRQLFFDSNIYNGIKESFERIKTGQTSYRKRFLIQKADKLISVETKDIACFYSEEKTTIIITKHKEEYFLNSWLDDIETELDPDIFFRANRQYIICIHSIKNISTSFNYRLKVELNVPAKTEIFISREKSALFKAWLDK